MNIYTVEFYGKDGTDALFCVVVAYGEDDAAIRAMEYILSEPELAKRYIRDVYEVPEDARPKVRAVDPKDIPGVVVTFQVKNAKKPPTVVEK